MNTQERKEAQAKAREKAKAWRAANPEKARAIRRKSDKKRRSGKPTTPTKPGPKAKKKATKPRAKPAAVAEVAAMVVPPVPVANRRPPYDGPPACMECAHWGAWGGGKAFCRQNRKMVYRWPEFLGQHHGFVPRNVKCFVRPAQ